MAMQKAAVLLTLLLLAQEAIEFELTGGNTDLVDQRDICTVKKKDFFKKLFYDNVQQSCYCSDPFLSTAPYAAETPDELTCGVECTLCDRSSPRCFVHKTCCSGVEKPDTSELQAIRQMRLGCMAVSKGDEYYSVIRSCPKDSSYSQRMLCEDDLAPEDVTVATIRLVTDVTTGITFYNKYCAECNNAQEVKGWSTRILCETALHLLAALTRDDVVKLSSDSRSSCSISNHPNGLDVVKCDRLFYGQDESIIRTCGNVTSKLSKLMTKVHEKCVSTPTTLLGRVKIGTTVYKNIYCLFCNNKFVASNGFVDDRKCSDEKRRDSAYHSVDLELDYQYVWEGPLERSIVSDVHSQTQCEDRGWIDAMVGNCRERQCSDGKVLTINHCETALPRVIRDLPYRIGLLLVAQSHVPMSRSIRNETAGVVISGVKNTVTEWLAPYVNTLKLDVGVALGHEELKTSSNNRQGATFKTFLLPRFVWLKIFFIPNPGISRDEVEKGVVDIFNKSQVAIKTAESYSSLYHVRFVNESSYNFASSCNQSQEPVCETSEFVNKRPLLPDMPGNFDVYSTARSDFVEVLTSLICPYIELSHEEVVVIIEYEPVPHTTKIILLFRYYIVELTEPSELNQISRTKNGSYHICAGFLGPKDQFRIKYTGLSGTVVVASDDVVSDIQYCMTVVCLSASLVCLAATVATYCLFPDLRCTVGCNTMGLSLSLAIAQILLLVGNSLQGPSTLCRVIGAITHYSWLVMFTWMFLCCLYVFRVFTGFHTTIIDDKSDNIMNKEKITNLMLSLTAPALVILVVIVTYMAVYNGSRVGYGYRACDTDSSFAMTGPLIFVIMCNAIFFVIVAIKVWGIRHLKQTKDTRKTDARRDLATYIQLSILTGMFWLLVVLGDAYDNDIIRCFAMLANGCLGVFIFASFVPKRRVLLYYQERFTTRRTALPSDTIVTTACPSSSIEAVQ